jgi:hypothetical protein
VSSPAASQRSSAAFGKNHLPVTLVQAAAPFIKLALGETQIGRGFVGGQQAMHMHSYAAI